MLFGLSYNLPRGSFETAAFQIEAGHMRTSLPLVLLATPLACSLLAMPVQAAARSRVFVASYGNDSNPCTFGSPCRTFQAAHDAVAAGGEITAIDSAGFSPVTITKAVSITSPAGIEAGIAAAQGGAAITINAGSGDVVSLHGLTLEGGGTGGLTGISFNTGKELDVVDCVIRDYLQGEGAAISVDAFSEMKITISNSNISNNTYGMLLQNQTGGLVADIDHVTATNNQLCNVCFFVNSASIIALITNSNITRSAIGISTASDLQSSPIYLTLVNDNFVDNGTAIDVDGTTQLALSHVTDAYSSNGSIYFHTSSTVATYSDGTNHVSLMGPTKPGSLGPWSLQ